MLHIFTLNWNAKEKLEKLISSIKTPLEGLDYIWHIRDNGSKDHTESDEDRWKRQLNIKFYNIGHNRDNFAQGMNYLFQQANPKDDDIILLLNNDIEFADDVSIKNMLSLMKGNVGVVGARLLYTGTEILAHAGVIFNHHETYGSNPFHYRWKEVSDEEAEKNREFQTVTAAVALVKANDWRKVGGFDESFRWAFDDSDFFMRIKYRLNKKVLYCGKTKIYHEESPSLKKNPINKMFIGQNLKNFRDKWEGKFVIDHQFYLNDKNYKLI